MFYQNAAFNQPIGNWDVFRMRSMSIMVYQNTVFNQPIGDWDISSVTSMNIRLSRTRYWVVRRLRLRKVRLCLVL